jgi:hypothetical protein
VGEHEEKRLRNMKKQIIQLDGFEWRIMDVGIGSFGLEDEGGLIEGSKQDGKTELK